MSDETKAITNPDPLAETAAVLADERTHWTGLDLPTWYLKVLNECEMMEQRIDEQAAKLKAQIAARKKALEWRWGAEFRARVEDDLARQKGKRRSVDFATGRAGFRSIPAKLVPTNAKELIDWASVNVPDAVKLEPKLHLTPLKEHIAKTGEVPPGCMFYDKRDQFYPTVMNKELPHEPERPPAGTDGPTEQAE